MPTILVTVCKCVCKCFSCLTRARDRSLALPDPTLTYISRCLPLPDGILQISSHHRLLTKVFQPTQPIISTPTEWKKVRINQEKVNSVITDISTTCDLLPGVAFNSAPTMLPKLTNPKGTTNAYFSWSLFKRFCLLAAIADNFREELRNFSSILRCTITKNSRHITDNYDYDNKNIR